ncbi:MAG: hypothetical protein WA667_24360 [Candidatus Nitrosopolaris sp.]
MLVKVLKDAPDFPAAGVAWQAVSKLVSGPSCDIMSLLKEAEVRMHEHKLLNSTFSENILMTIFEQL